MEAADTNVPFAGTLDILEGPGVERVRCPRTSFPEIYIRLFPPESSGDTRSSHRRNHLENHQERLAFCKGDRQAGSSEEMKPSS